MKLSLPPFISFDRVSKFMKWLQSNPWFSVFVVLVGMKACLLFLGREQLVQEHWRIRPEKPALWRTLLFSGLMGLSILIPIWLQPKKRCSASVKTWLILFGAGMAFLMPVLLWRNYIFTVMDGPLKLWEIGHYLIADIFFQAPYLILHLIALAVVWIISARRGDDRIFLSVFAASMTILCATQMLVYNHRIFLNELWLLSALLLLGIVQLVAHQRLRRRIGFQPFIIVSAVLGWFMYLGELRWVSLGFHLVYLMMGLGFAWTLRKSIFKGETASGCICVFWVYIYFLSINYGYPLNGNMGNLFRLGLLFGRYVSDDLIAILFLYLLLRRFRRGGLAVFGVLSLIYLAAAYVDLNYYIESGRRISGFMLEMGGGTGMAVKMVSDYLTVSFFLKFTAMALLSLSGVTLAMKGKTDACPKGVVRRWFVIALILSVSGALWCNPDSFVASFPRNLLSDSSFFRNLRSPMIPQRELVDGFKKAGVPLSFASGIHADKPKAKKNLVLVVLESMPNRYLSLFSGIDETQPLLTEYADRMERYPNIFCSWPSSNHARSTVWSGLYPIRPFLSVVNPLMGRESLTEILAAEGYYNTFFYSSDRNYTRLNDYLGHRGLHLIEDSGTMDKNVSEEQLVSWGVREDVTLAAMTNFLNGCTDRQEPFSMTYIPACPHSPFDTIDERFEVFEEGGGILDGNFTGTYKNQLLYMDWILHSLIRCLDEKGFLDNTVVVLVNDHAEFVNAAQGGLGHGWSSRPDIANIPLIVFSPETGGSINPAVGSQIDVLPTLLDYLQIDVPHDMPMQGVSLKNRRTDDRRIFMGSYKDYSVIEGHSFYWVPNGDLSSAKQYNLSNQGARTLFTEVEGGADPEKWTGLEEDYGLFRSLQESLIRHYDEYDWQQTD